MESLQGLGPEGCPGYEGCSAPLCPRDYDVCKRQWYADEPVCQGRGYSHLHWLRIQKRIARKKLGWNAGYFTVALLDKIQAVVKPRGLNPDSDTGSRVGPSKIMPRAAVPTQTARLVTGGEAQGGGEMGIPRR